MRLLNIALMVILIVILSPLVPSAQTEVVQAAVMPSLKNNELPPGVLSPMWPPSIRQWSNHIEVLADTYGIAPDFIASVIKEESNGDHHGVSHMGAVGLMGVMPTGPGLEWRPSTEELMNPATNLRWGVAILSEVIRQSGGDLYAALAAYNGGWDQVDHHVPRGYASDVLDNYGRAIATRSGISPDIAAQWTVAIEISHGNVPNEPLLILGDQPVSGLKTYGEHVVYHYADPSGPAYYIKGYAVPVALVAGSEQETDLFGSGHHIEEQLQIRLGEISVKSAEEGRNPRVLIACLPSLSRLRGRVSTRWFAPSYCPSWHR